MRDRAFARADGRQLSRIMQINLVSFPSSMAAAPELLFVRRGASAQAAVVVVVADGKVMTEQSAERPGFEPGRL